MPHINVYIHASKPTTRDGSHPDDEAYIAQVKGQLALRLSELEFVNSHIEIGWGEIEHSNVT